MLVIYASNKCKAAEVTESLLRQGQGSDIPKNNKRVGRGRQRYLRPFKDDDSDSSNDKKWLKRPLLPRRDNDDEENDDEDNDDKENDDNENDDGEEDDDYDALGQEIQYFQDVGMIYLKGYVPFFSDRMVDGQFGEGGTKADAPGHDTWSYVEYEAIRKRVKDTPILLERGDTYRSNELGLARLNTYFYPECKKDHPRARPFNFTYCGIALGYSRDDHKLVRPSLDKAYGSGRPNGVMSEVGNKWTRESLLEDARSFFKNRNTLEVQHDAFIWSTTVLHRIGLNIELTRSEAESFIRMLYGAKEISKNPNFVIENNPEQWKLEEILDFKEYFYERYIEAIRKNIESGEITDLEIDDDEGIFKLAWIFMDSHVWAGGLSVPSLIQSTLAANATGIAGNDFDISDRNQASLLLMECVRLYPPVLGFPSTDSKTHFRYAPCVGMSGYDRKKFGSDADDFRFGRMTMPEYHSSILDWADVALGEDDAPWSARICPAKSLSFQMILAFLEAMNPNEWAVSDESEEIKRLEGFKWWTQFTLVRKWYSVVNDGLDEKVQGSENDELFPR